MVGSKEPINDNGIEKSGSGKGALDKVGSHVEAGLPKVPFLIFMN